MEIMYWTFPHMSGKWSVVAGDPLQLECGPARHKVYWTLDGFPILGDTIGTLWVDGPAVQEGKSKLPEKSGGSVDYYQVRINNPTSKNRAPYTAECNDIIEALGMNYAEGNSFKALWRSCAARTLGKLKEGGDAVYDAEKNVFFAQRILIQRKGKDNNATEINCPH